MHWRFENKIQNNNKKIENLSAWIYLFCKKKIL